YFVLMAWLMLTPRLRARADPHTAEPRDKAGRTVPHGRAAFLRKVFGTAVGGYLLLLAVLAPYALTTNDPVAFLISSLSGPALLIAVTLPVFIATSWAVVRRHRGPGPGERRAK
ncbi:MAG TPA: DUF6256 family protein, partial [Yinghuangia sp.]|nr:DUF6256 family protein [Yinghuangia sp.]